MKQRIVIHRNDRTIFKGKPLRMPIKEEAIIKKSAELFNDPDPCIIHQSYARQKIVDRIMALFPKKSSKNIPLKDYHDQLDELDVEDLEDCLIDIEVKP
ncbi:MAG: hypothetical protein ACLFTZ_05805 [Acholeplasmataceae bacterium]